jgi:hypothetical protein
LLILFADMLFHFFSDLVLVIHLFFIIFAVLGVFLVLKWRVLAWIHVPTFLWAVFIEFANWVCPLTPLENWLRTKGGSLPYRTTFVEHYILPLVYPSLLTRNLQIFLGFFVLSINLGLYGWIIWRTKKM